MTDLTTTISADQFAAGHAFVKDVLAVQAPELDLSAGSALDGLLVAQEAYLAALHESRLDQLSLSFSLEAIADNLATVDDAHVDSLVSNYFLVRRTDTAATGPVRIVTNTPVPLQIPTGFAFTFNGLTFTTAQSFRIYAADSVGVIESAGTRRMVERADGLFEFTVTVVASSPGAASKLAAGTVLTIANPLAGMITAITASDFVGGQARETNAELLARAQSGITAKVVAGPDHIQAVLTAQFPGTRCAVVGVGSPLMTRDRHNLFGLSTGGKQDIYCRTTDFVRTKTIRASGTVVNAVARQVLLPIPYADGVGVYRIVAIRPAGLAALDGDRPDQTTVATYTGTTFIPTIGSPAEAAYSANGLLSAVFTDTLTVGALTLNQVIGYDVDLTYMPGIEAISTYLTDQGVRPAGQDLLVKAGVPCTVTIATTVRVPNTTALPAVGDLRQAIADAINALPFGTPNLSAYIVHRAVGQLLPKGDLIDTTIRGILLAPDQTDVGFANTTNLIVPTDGRRGFGPANTYFSCAPEAVGLTIVSY